MSIVKFTIKGRYMTATAEEVIARLKDVLPDPVRSIVVEVSGVTYPVKQAFSAAFGIDKSEFISHQAQSVLERLGFQVSRVQNNEAQETAKNLFGIQLMTWVAVEAETETQALSLACQYATALGGRKWAAADHLVSHGVVASASGAVHDVEDWNEAPAREQIDEAWQGIRQAVAEGISSGADDTCNVTRVMAWQDAHAMPN